MLQATKALSEKFDALQQDVETLKTGSSQETSATQETATTQETAADQATPVQTHTSWEKRAESPGSEDQVDYNLELNWSDDQSSKLMKLSDETNAVVAPVFTQSMDNATRQQTRSHFILPSMVVLKTPRLDDVLKAEASSTAKSLGKELAKSTNFHAGRLSPLTQVLDEAQQGQLHVTLEGAVEAVETALNEQPANITQRA